eukprot:2037106-Rhodomonas_salina.1
MSVPRIASRARTQGEALGKKRGEERDREDGLKEVATQSVRECECEGRGGERESEGAVKEEQSTSEDGVEEEEQGKGRGGRQRGPSGICPCVGPDMHSADIDCGVNRLMTASCKLCGIWFPLLLLFCVLLSRLPSCCAPLPSDTLPVLSTSCLFALWRPKTRRGPCVTVACADAEGGR